MQFAQRPGAYQVPVKVHSLRSAPSSAAMRTGGRALKRDIDAVTPHRARDVAQTRRFVECRIVRRPPCYEFRGRNFVHSFEHISGLRVSREDRTLEVKVPRMAQSSIKM